MDSGEALDDDGSSSQVAWLQSSVLSTGSFTIVLVSYHNPVHAVALDFKIKKEEQHFKLLLPHLNISDGDKSRKNEVLNTCVHVKTCFYTNVGVTQC